MSSEMTRGEIANLERLIRKREKVLRAAIEQRTAELKADFEAQMAVQYSFDADPVWKQAFTLAKEAAKAAQTQVGARCEELGIPREFAPSLECYWYGRGENAVKARRAELRQKADAEIEALKKSARTKIELWSLNAQTDLAAQTLTSDAAKTFLQNMPSTEDLMPKLEYQQVHALLEGGKP
jgi:hypothetical protein